MAQEFLTRLPRVRSEELPNGAECMICMEEYGAFPSNNGVIEHAVLLPCLHTVGSECIATWLSPTRRGNSCPLCRTVFFPAQVFDFHDEFSDGDDDELDEDGDEDDEDGNNEEEYGDEEDEDGNEEGNEEGDGDDGGEAGDAEDRTDGRAQTMNILATVQRVGSYFLNTPYGTETKHQDGQEWFTRWPLATSQQIGDCENSAQWVPLRLPPIRSVQRSLLQTCSPPADWKSRVESSLLPILQWRSEKLYRS